jgi:hypothetical protein
MSKFLKSLSDGSLRCRYCGDKECNCLEDGKTTLEYKEIWFENEWSVLIQFKQQRLVSGKKIPSGYKVFICKRDIIKRDTLLKKITITNDQINRLRFD